MGGELKVCACGWVSVQGCGCTSVCVGGTPACLNVSLYVAVCMGVCI